MKVLITGAGGFVGRHLTSELQSFGHETVLTGLVEEPLPGLGTIRPLDIRNADQCLELLFHYKPDAVVHLAGLAHTAAHNSNTQALYDINVAGPVNIASTLSRLCHEQPDVKRSLLFVSSSFVYGGKPETRRLVCSETTQTCPRTKYGESKLIAESAVKFFEHDSFKVYVARPFNHIGSGQDSSFVVPAFVKRIHDASDGDMIETGDLTALRDFTDVRDIVRGYRLILERQPKEHTFVFGQGKTVAIKSILDQLLALSGKKLGHRVNATLLRGGIEPEIMADTSLAMKSLQWRPEISLQDTLLAIWNSYKHS